MNQTRRTQINSKQLANLIRSSAKQVIASNDLDTSTRKGNKELDFAAKRMVSAQSMTPDEAEQLGTTLGEEIVALSRSSGRTYLDQGVIRRLVVEGKLPALDEKSLEAIPPSEAQIDTSAKNSSDAQLITESVAMEKDVDETEESAVSDVEVVEPEAVEPEAVEPEADGIEETKAAEDEVEDQPEVAEVEAVEPETDETEESEAAEDEIVDPEASIDSSSLDAEAEAEALTVSKSDEAGAVDDDEEEADDESIDTSEAVASEAKSKDVIGKDSVDAESVDRGEGIIEPETTAESDGVVAEYLAEEEQSIEEDDDEETSKPLGSVTQ